MTRASKSETTRSRHTSECKAEALKLAETVGVNAAGKQLGPHVRRSLTPLFAQISETDCVGSR